MQIKNGSLTKATKSLICTTPVLAMLWALPAQAETTNCIPITGLPAVINTQGIHCFTGDLATSATTGNAIDIMVNNVTIDMNGFKLGGLGAGPTSTAIGINATDKKNITLRNGSIRGFNTGIYLQQTSVSSGHLVEDMVMDGNLSTAIWLEGNGIVARNNRIVNTSSALAALTNIAGILGSSLSNSQITNNLISATTALAGDAFGIFLNSSQTVETKGNTVFNTVSNTGFGQGIYTQFTTNSVIQGNTILGVTAGPNPSTAIGIENQGSSSILCLGNIVNQTTDAQTLNCNAESGTFPTAQTAPKPAKAAKGTVNSNGATPSRI